MAQYEGRAIDWDEDYNYSEGKKEFTLLAPGTYPFEITKFERARFNGGGKIGPCGQANITIKVSGVDDNGAMAETSISDNFKLWESLAWRVAQLARCIGEQPVNISEDGSPEYRLNWNNVVGKSGIVEIKHREYNGKTYNDISKYVAPEDVKNIGPNNKSLQPQQQMTPASQAQMQPPAQPQMQPGYQQPQPQTTFYQQPQAPSYQAVQAAYNAVQSAVNTARGF